MPLNVHTILALASKQIWPHVLTAIHFQPQRIVLLHSSEVGESRAPAERLSDFYVRSGILAAGMVFQREIPYDDFTGIREKLDALSSEFGLDQAGSALNFTGGNKLMSTAAFDWAQVRGITSFYLERANRVFVFEPRDSDLLVGLPLALNSQIARNCDPIDLLRCQIGASEIEDEGQLLTLNARGKDMPEPEFQPLLKQSFDFRKLLDVTGAPEREQEKGFALEYATAAVLLKLGVPMVRRSVKLKPHVLGGSKYRESELDLVFNWEGKLWLADCKDKVSELEHIKALETELLKETFISDHAKRVLDRIKDELTKSQTSSLKHDLLAIQEIGGLLGRAFCVRKTRLEPWAYDFASSRQLPVILKESLFGGLRRLLYPPGKAQIT